MTKTLSPEVIAAERVKRLTVVRFAGVLLALIGVAAIAGKIALPLPRLLGLLMVLGGAYYVLIFPAMLIRRWKRADRGADQT